MQRLIDVGFGGSGRFGGAVEVAEQVSDRGAAVQRLIATHVRLAAASGLVPLVGGPIGATVDGVGYRTIATRSGRSRRGTAVRTRSRARS